MYVIENNRIPQNNMLEFRLIDNVSLKSQEMTRRADQHILFALKTLASNQTNLVYTLHQLFCHLASLPR
jgi:hypothetical protein